MMKNSTQHRQLHTFKTVFGLTIAMLLLYSQAGLAQLTVTANQTAAQLAQILTGNGVTVLNATLGCPTAANGKFVVGPLPSNLGIDSGIVLTSGYAATVGANIGANGPQSSFASVSNGGGSDPDLASLTGQTINDACKLEFDFVPAGDTVKFDYVFGSEEYDSYSCSSFNDGFGFLISGPGITGSQNIALVPGTTIPVTVNSTTNPAVTLPNSLTMCQAMGTGSPFAQYYVDNSSGTTVTYYGFTTILQAITPVIPCDTYHLKLAIGDASDGALDSGVFLKAGSLNSNAIAITPIGGGGLTAPVPYCVRGCLPGQFNFSRPVARPTPLTIHYIITGTATNGVDYTQIPDSVVIPANGTTATRLIYALNQSTPQGTETVKLKILSPYSCNGTALVIDSAELTIFDSLQVNITTPDTAICRNETVNLHAQGDNLLTYSWSPTTWLSSTNTPNTSATPQVTTTYGVSVTLPGSGCPAAHDYVTITVKQEPLVNAGPDTTTCVGTPYTFPMSVSPAGQTYNFAWSPTTYLNDTTLASPTALPTADGTITYVVTVNSGAVGCNGYDTVKLRVLPPDIALLNIDTAICRGMAVQTRVNGHPAFQYIWSPTAGVSNPTLMTPSIIPDTSALYTIKASFPGCPDRLHSFYIDVQPNPVVNVGPDLAKCQWDTLQLRPYVGPTWYQHYSYAWTPTGDVDDPTKQDVVFSGQSDAVLTLTVKTPAGCTGSDNLNITVHQGNFGTLDPEGDVGLCPRDSIVYTATGGVKYHWTPGLFLSDTNSATPVSKPITDVAYTLLITDQFGCFDTLYSSIDVHPDALLTLADSVRIYPGENTELSPSGNCLYFNWSPPLGLSNASIANPVAMPPVNTRYFVTGTTEHGCFTTDSIDVFVSPETLLDLPNAFSPGSAPNQDFKIVKRGLASLNYFRIFNRWGVKVFETKDITQGWDGRFNGEPQPMGTYIYIVEALTNTGQRFYKQGNVTLIR